MPLKSDFKLKIAFNFLWLHLEIYYCKTFKILIFGHLRHKEFILLSHMRKRAFMCIHVITHYSVRLSLCILLVLAFDSGIAACQWHHDIHCQHSFHFPQYRNSFKWISCLGESVCCAYSGNRVLFKIFI